jgi:hypothetical protein
VIYGVISPATASFTSASMCVYVVCACKSQMFRLAVKGTCTFLLSFVKIKVWSIQKTDSRGENALSLL